jgi:uncharacterized Tic20 family protein
MPSLLLVSVKKPDVIIMSLPFNVIWHFSLVAFSILSFYCTLNVLTIICQGEMLSWSCLVSVLKAS